MKKRLTLFLPLVLLFLSITANNNNNDLFVENNEVSIYPIPAKKYFTIEVPENYKGGKIIITNIVGKEVMQLLIQNETKVKVLTDEFSKGIYFISIQVNTEMVFTKRIVIDK